MPRKSSTTGARGFRQPPLPNDLTEVLREKVNQLPGSVKADHLKKEIFSKFVSSETAPPDVRANAAIEKWLETERINEATTDRLLAIDAEYNILPRVPFQRFVDFCCDTIVGIIGDTPPVDALIGTFSGGASTSRSRTHSQPAGKYVGKADVTFAGSDPFIDIVMEETPVWCNAQSRDGFDIRCVPGNAMFTVPKKTDIDRVAAKEPDLNMFIQKGIGSFFRTGLRRTGINLNDQSINRSLALRGSIDGSLATLDLSSASDSVTTELVFQLLPVTWFTLLDSVRSRVTVLPNGDEHRNVMFSSMGNGFTFELESLLFYTLMRATAYFTGTPGVISVYGDDIVIPTEMADYAMFVLGVFGFRVNPDKSFISGPFRESCGGHYWRGIDVTPFYIKEPISDVLGVIDAANKLRKWSEIRVQGELLSPILDPEAEEIWLWLRSYVPRCLWGGGDTSFKYQLASLDAPDSRIVEETSQKSAGTGGYLHWLNTTGTRTTTPGTLLFNRGVSDWKPVGPVETSSFSIPLNRHRLRKVRSCTVPRLETLFRPELG